MRVSREQFLTDRKQFFKSRVDLLFEAVKEQSKRSEVLSEGDSPCYPYVAGFMSQFLVEILDQLDPHYDQTKRFEKTIQSNIDYLNSLDLTAED